MIKSIVVQFQIEGFHNWPDAPGEVGFLAARHRHMFHYKVEVEVKHSDREIELILFKRELEAFVRGFTPELGSSSCEMLAECVVQYILAKYGWRKIAVSVFEDGENGAIVSNA